eukprot:6437370-Pyramimonas_sp.AAC.1
MKFWSERIRTHLGEVQYLALPPTAGLASLRHSGQNASWESSGYLVEGTSCRGWTRTCLDIPMKMRPAR